MSKITKSAKGQECQVRIPGVCNHNPETTILAHINGGGWATKKPDCEAAYACSDCHTWLDGGYVNDKRFSAKRMYRDLYHYESAMRTRAILIENGLILLK